MSTSTIATSVLELTTDGTKYEKGLTDAEVEAKQAFSRIVQQVNAFGKSVDDAASKLNNIGKKAKEEADKTNAALDSIKKIAVGVGAAIGTAFAVTKIIEAGKQVIDYAGHVVDMSAKLKVSTTTIQQWEAAFGQSGVSLETVAGASDKLTEKLIGGDESAVAALGKMGLSVEKLKAMKPEDRFITVADAIGNMKDAGEQLYASKTLLGGGGPDLLAALDGHLGDTIKQFDAMGLVIDEETLKAADDFGDQLGMLAKQLLAVVAAIVGPLLPVLSLLADGLMEAWRIIGLVLRPVIEFLTKAILQAASAIFDFLGMVVDAAQKIPILGKHLGVLSTVSGYYHTAADKLRGVLERLGEKTEDAGEKAKTAAPKILGLGKDTSVAARENEQFTKSLAELAFSITGAQRAGVSLGEMVDKFGKSAADAVLEARILGREVPRAVTDMANAWTRSELEKRALETSKKIRDAWAAAMADNVKSAEASLAIIVRAVLSNQAVLVEATRKYDETVVKMNGDAFAARLAQVDEWVEAERKKLDQHAKNYDQASRAIDRAGDAMRRAIQVDDAQRKMKDLVGAIAEIGSAIETVGRSSSGSFGKITSEIGRTVTGISQALQAVGQYYAATTNAGRAAALANAAANVAAAGQGHQSQGGAIVGGAISGLTTAGTLSNWNPYAVAGGAIAGAVAGVIQFQQEQEQSLSHMRDALRSLADPTITGDLNRLLAGEIAVADRAERAGVSVARFWAATQEQDTEEMQAAIEEIDSALARHDAALQTAVTGITRFATVSRSASDDVRDSQQTVDALRESLAEKNAELADGGRLSDDQRGRLESEALRLQQALEEQEARLARQQRLVNTLAFSSASAGDAIAGAAVVGWGEMLDAGMPILEIVERMGPVIMQLDDQLAAAGLSGGEAFQSIKDMAALAQDDIGGPVIEAVGGLGQTLEGLNQIGRLSQSQFSGIASQVTTMFNSLVEGGANGAAAMGDMQPTLQTIWELVHNNHMEVDGQTQALLDQAEAAGVVGAQHQDIQHQMLDALNRTADAVQTLGRFFDTGLPLSLARSANAADGLKSSIDRIPSRKDVEIATRYTSSGSADASVLNIKPMANGGIGRVTGPTLFLAGEDGSEEYAFSGANRSFGRQSDKRRGGDGDVIVQVDGREIARATIPHLYDTAQSHGAGV